MKIFRTIVLVPLLALLVGIAVGIKIGSSFDIPFIREKTEWSIGILTGDSPFTLRPPEGIQNPVLTAADVTDVEARAVADPFMVVENSEFYMFLEVIDQTNQGDIGLATSQDGMHWTYQQIILDEPFHLSYPYVFTWNGEYYLIPESADDFSIRLYKAKRFPTEWQFVGPLLTGSDFVDPSIFRFQNMWWLFVSSPNCDILRLYCADELTGPWREHPQSPLIKKNANIARPGGRVLEFQGRLFRFAQDDEPTYGNQLHAFEITTLTPTAYQEAPVKESPILRATGTGWNANGMHHIDHQRLEGGKWIACVDGVQVRKVFGLTD